MTDLEAWQELSELYITELDFSKAAFCVEELILHNPHNHLLHQRYADIKYSQGGAENLEIARTYYFQALKLNPKNIRALYGVYLVKFNTKCPKSFFDSVSRSTRKRRVERARVGRRSLRSSF